MALPSPPAHRHTRRSRPSRRPIELGFAAAIVLLLVGSAAPVLAQDASTQEVTIEKSTNGVDADTAPGPVVEIGAAVTWTWTVSASGTVTLYDLLVTDSSGVVPDCDVNGDGQGDGTNIHPGPIEPGQSFTCTGSGAADHDPAAGPFAATGSVRASDFAATGTFQDDDASHHSVDVPVVAEPGLSIQALVNGQIGEGAEGPLVAEGAAITWTYVVTNTGNAPLTGIRVTDEGGSPVDCGSGSSTIPGSLAPGASASCIASTSAADQADGPQSKTGSVLASALHPTTGAEVGPVRASDVVTYTPVQVPARLAFTGPSSFVLPLGLALTALGAVLLLAARRRPALAIAAPEGSDTEQADAPITT